MKQLEMALRKGAGRGAPGGKRRPGGGRKPAGPRAHERHETRPWHEGRHPVHVVVRVVDGIRLRRRAGWHAVRHAMGVALKRHDFRICHASIQATHLHLIVEADDRMALARGMQGFAISCARRFNASIRRRGQLFWDRYHPVALKTPQQVRNAVSYCLNNWRRHREDRHAPAHVRFDPYSSGPQWGAWRARPLSETDPERERLPIVIPATWLLQIGWRRHGPISPLERPGPLQPTAAPAA
jgi:REP element-mobilizing transposase RayT